MLCRSFGHASRTPEKRTARKLFQPAGCPVDCLGLTEVVTQRGPQRAAFGVMGCTSWPLAHSGARHSLCPVDQTILNQPYSRMVCERMSLFALTKGSQELPLEQPL